jgi:hypothetical protein
MLDKIANIAAIVAFVCLILGFGYAEWIALQTPHSEIHQERANNAEHNTNTNTKSVEEGRSLRKLWLVIPNG